MSDCARDKGTVLRTDYLCPSVNNDQVECLSWESDARFVEAPFIGPEKLWENHLARHGKRTRRIESTASQYVADRDNKTKKRLRSNY